MRYSEFSFIGYEGAAIFHERVSRDYETARQIVAEGIARTESKRWKASLQARWDRLQQKKLGF